MRLSRLTLAVAALVILVDAVAKVVVAHALTAGRVVHVTSWLDLDLYYNHAGSRNSLTGRPVLVSVLSILACCVLAAMATRTRTRGFSVGLGFLLGGGIGNLLDRLFGAPGPLRGGVIDWIQPFGSTGSMNLADLSINLGLIVLALTAVVQWFGVRGEGARSQRPSTQPTV